MAHGKAASSAHLRKNLWRDVRRRVEEVKDVARMLNADFIRLLSECEAVVPRAVEVLVAACAVLQLVAVARADGELLGHAAREDGLQF